LDDKNRKTAYNTEARSFSQSLILPIRSPNLYTFNRGGRRIFINRAKERHLGHTNNSQEDLNTVPKDSRLDSDHSTSTLGYN